METVWLWQGKGMAWYGMAYGTYGIFWYGMVWQGSGMVWYVVRYFFCMVLGWCGTVWSGM